MTPSVVDQPTGELYNSGMAFTLNLKPEVEQRLKELAEAEHRSMHKTVEVAVQAYLDRHERDEWTRQARVTGRPTFRRTRRFARAPGARPGRTPRICCSCSRTARKNLRRGKER